MFLEAGGFRFECYVGVPRALISWSIICWVWE